MRTPYCVAALAALAVAVAPGQAVNLAQVDRAIAKEPAYQSRAPKYCLLVFGPEAKTRVWLVLDGETLFVDRNGNGDLTEPGERITSSGSRGGKKFQQFTADIEDAAVSKTKYALKAEVNAEGASSLSATFVAGGGTRTQRAGLYPKWDGLQFTDRPQDAPIIHFNGPLRLELGDYRPNKKESGTYDLDVLVATPGLGPNTVALFLPSQAPTAEIEYPNQQGGEAIKIKVPLKPG